MSDDSRSIWTADGRGWRNEARRCAAESLLSRVRTELTNELNSGARWQRQQGAEPQRRTGLKVAYSRSMASSDLPRVSIISVAQLTVATAVSAP